MKIIVWTETEKLGQIVSPNVSLDGNDLREIIKNHCREMDKGMSADIFSQDEFFPTHILYPSGEPIPLDEHLILKNILDDTKDLDPDDLMW